jgi:PAS domain S-box-containing protein
MTLKARVVLLVVVMLIAGIWGLALSVTLALQRDLTEMHSASLSAEIVSVAADLDHDVKLQIDVLVRLAATLTPEIQGDPSKLDHALDQFADTSVIVPDVCFVADRNGIVTARYPGRAVSLGASVGDLGYFREVIASGKPVIGAPVLAGSVQKRPAVPIAVPLRDAHGVTVGALVGLVALSDPMMLGQFQHTRIGEHGYFLVMSPKDRLILAAPDPSRILQQLPPKGVIPLLDRRLKEGFEGPGILVSSLGVEHLGVARKMATTGWMVLAAVPTEEIFAPIENFKRWVYLAALLISLAIAVILRFFLARQFAPLAQAGGAMRRMTEGEIPLAVIPVTRQDEIGELIANFNRLVAERNRLDQSLQGEIIQRKHANDALIESACRLDGIYQSVADGIISVDAQQRIVLFNAAAERIFAYSAAEMIGQPLSLLLPQRFRPQHEEHMRNFDSTGQTIRRMGTYGLVYALRRSGEEFPVEAAVSQSGFPPNKLFTVILRDITERRQAEQMRERLMRQLELLSERFATAQEEERGNIAYELHEELGQELTTLKLYLQMLAPGSGGTGAETPHKEALAVATHATERVRKLVLDLEPRELADFGLHAAVYTYCQRQAAPGGWNLHIDVPTPLVRAPRAVERACFRVLQEALSNVRHHAQATEVWVHVHQGADILELWIRDNGVGFNRDALRDENRRGGGGLGLFGMQIRAKHVGGAVEIKSTAGAGTEVRAVFPLPVAPVEPV